MLLLIPCATRAVDAQPGIEKTGNLSDRQPAAAGYYGCPWRSQSLSNIIVGDSPGRAVSFRFRARHSAKLEAVQIYLMANISKKEGYSKGDGGHLRCELQTDDGTAGHYPSGQVLARFTAANLQSLAPMHNGSYFGKLFFQRPAALVKGRLYHLVFTNTHPDSRNNWFSLDCLWNNPWDTPRCVPTLPDTDLAVLVRWDARSSWNGGPPWKRFTPIYTLRLSNGLYQGQCYVNHRLSVMKNIQGGTRVRTRFTVSGGNKVASQVHVAVRKHGNPTGNLSIRLEDGQGHEIETVSVPPSQIKTQNNWVGRAFATAHTLIEGREYRLVLSAPASAGGFYQAYPCTDGVSYGLDGDWAFRDGLWEYTTDAGATWYPEGGDDDMQFYFTVN
jgi:hypothetical protein